MSVASIVALRAPVLPKLAARPRPARRLAVATRANLVSDVGKYLSEAASQIFYPQENDTPWKGSGTPFTGSIKHHEDTARLRKLNEVIESVRLEMEASGEVNPNAAAADDASATYKLDDQGQLVEDGSLQDYMTNAVGRIFAHNFKGDENEPKDWASAGYKNSWRRGSRREVQREYDRLVRFQKVVKKTLEEAEATAKN